jgi:hypothetical protein
MSNPYDDDAQRALMVQTQQNRGGFTNWIRNNPWTAILIALIILGLLWWFCWRKGSTDKIQVSTGSPSAPGGQRVNITKASLRGGLY